MATNKNAFLRYKVLDNCFRNAGKKYYIEDLIVACNKALTEQSGHSNGISRRQIFDDIQFMESENGWSIDLKRNKDGRRVYYRYADLKFSVNNMPLNETEIRHLESAIETIGQFKGLPQFSWVTEITSKLKYGLNTDKLEEPILDFDSNPYLKGIENLSTLYNAIFYKKVLLIKYEPYGQQPFELTIHPYFLKEYNNRWFLFGYNNYHHKFDWNIALDRIVYIEETNGAYQENKVINWQDYFDEVIGVTKSAGKNIEQIIINFFGITGHYITSKPMHGSQKSKWLSDETLEVRLELVINYEFEKEILSYCDQVKIISPSHLADKIAKRLKNAYNTYIK